MAMASAGPYANHLHLAPDRWPRQYLNRLDALPAACKAVTGLATFSARIVIYLMLIRRAGNNELRPNRYPFALPNQQRESTEAK